MSVKIGEALPERVVGFLQGGRTTVVATADREGNPWTGVMSWVRARDARTVLMIVAKHSRSLQNIRENGKVALQLLGDDFVYGVTGRARVAEESIEGAPVPAAMVEVEVLEVKDDLTPGRVWEAKVESYWPDPAKQQVEDAGLVILRSY
jgi:predicted pyridoxine 5'-phosphate oxidase superfamily flavin-nucleotide-binding protein